MLQSAPNILDFVKKSQPCKIKEWTAQKRWNPFNSYKLLVHVERWRQIKRGRPIPPPVLITVDPTNICNFNCVWCNAEYIRTHRCQWPIILTLFWTTILTHLGRKNQPCRFCLSR